jgi:hypothetical protein
VEYKVEEFSQPVLRWRTVKYISTYLHKSKPPSNDAGPRQINKSRLLTPSSACDVCMHVHKMRLERENLVAWSLPHGTSRLLIEEGAREGAYK